MRSDHNSEEHIFEVRIIFGVTAKIESGKDRERQNCMLNKTRFSLARTREILNVLKIKFEPRPTNIKGV